MRSNTPTWDGGDHTASAEWSAWGCRRDKDISALTLLLIQAITLSCRNAAENRLPRLWKRRKLRGFAWTIYICDIFWEALWKLYSFSSKNTTEDRLCLSSLNSLCPAVLLDLTTASCLTTLFFNCRLVLLKEQTRPRGSHWQAACGPAARTRWVLKPTRTHCGAGAQARAFQTSPGSQKCLCQELRA